MRCARSVAGGRTFPRAWALILTVLSLAAQGCAGHRAPLPEDPDAAIATCTPDDCVVVDVAVSPEKTDLVARLAKDFNATGATVGTRRIVVRPREKASGTAQAQLAAGWPDEADDPRPVIWSPAASAWGTILDQQQAVRGRPPLAGSPVSLMSSPLVIAMPRRMAQALGYPGRAIGWSDVLALAADPAGWASVGHPEWGPFRLGKTNPRFSTSGLHAFLAQNYAAAGRTSGLTLADLAEPSVVAANRAVESAVVHYGDTTLTFLNNWYRADQRGTPYGYASAVAVEEKSVIDYNLGNPDGITDPGEIPRRPREPLVAVYPREGTILSDNPAYVLDADWVSADQRAAARAFLDFVQRPENERNVLQSGFRPGNPQVPVGAPITPDNGVDPTQPTTTLALPSGEVLDALLGDWSEQRKSARVLLVVDVSGSMADQATPAATRLDLAKQAAAQSLDQFKDDDEVGLRQFSTNLGPGKDQDFVDLAPLGALRPQDESLRRQIESLVPTNGTPLYDVTRASMASMLDGYDPGRINAVVLLTDGRNQDGTDGDDDRQLKDLVRYLQSRTQEENARPVRLFTIGYGDGVDANVLKQLAEATNGRYYSATSDLTTIAKVFTQVISNF